MDGRMFFTPRRWIFVSLASVAAVDNGPFNATECTSFESPTAVVVSAGENCIHLVNERNTPTFAGSEFQRREGASPGPRPKAGDQRSALAASAPAQPGGTDSQCDRGWHSRRRTAAR